ncbi:aminotransferase class I/II-fold pyridoxal phosphate-dependent enzyme [Mycolicibacillus parakoreensis]|uniref:Aminotransferase class I/II-fold pyridoxal phosphate-dependent enzyme n=1 Tax=Mycolicibacillus parakoreensis TaxID=1069221 RepID=A0ABY3TXY3_9MYCO|nr:aminotransferase class I/II-fold pyridoxal phosphate-dependent enzyme [Mycolicibacillus parakoreensis]MCV7315841.1 aminotransferase class I/II-fold pyridoxal phosphate-dependent enzyme [Mycolicibacillus parakoreensis]ULN51739.1 aminotransferase class I/II-fold pyridoxal phosphate-dependent enzyme [Mycolicibacillus parakoreensis]HLR98277.1 aminotransferase class I/II-fold pyridoxal phosphate-dependent enzyme [Mycolicibacillus parakoreensis]
MTEHPRTPDGPGLGTRSVHAGDRRDTHGAIHPPIYPHSTFAFARTADLLDVIEERTAGALYTRYGGNPTVVATEAKLADLEGAQAALAFSSGMAAISAALLAHVRTGEQIVCVGDLYGGTYELLTENLPRLGITTAFLPAEHLDRLPAACTDATRVVFFETPSNPTLTVLDIAAVSAAARAAGALTIIDNTFATPVNQNPLAHGADLVMHSATKYLGGHSDLTAGALMGSAELLAPVAFWRKNLGQMIAPEVSSLLARSLRSLPVRVARHNAGAAAVAAFLAGHPAVVRVNYPGLAAGAAKTVVDKQMRGHGGMLSFVLDADAAATAAVVDRLALFSIAGSLGGVESLVTQPITTSHHGMPPAERRRRGISDGMIRLSVGLEDPADLIADLEQALAPLAR